MVTTVAQKEANRRWREKHPEYQREYRKQNPDKFQRYREKARREHPYCEVCGTSLDLRVHHRTPVSQGGTHKKENLMILCEKHHWAKGTGIHWHGEEVSSATKQLTLVDSTKA